MIKIDKAGLMAIGELKSFLADGERIGVFRKGEKEFYTFQDECTHDGAPICDGEAEGDLVICARHGAKFNMKDGSVQGMPATSPLEAYKNKFLEGELYVDLDA